MHRRDLTLCLVLLAVQVSCALGRNNFYEYFYSLHHRSSSTANLTPSMPSSGSPAPDSSSVTTAANAMKDSSSSDSSLITNAVDAIMQNESLCCSTEIMLSNSQNDGNIDQSSLAWIILWLIVGIIIDFTCIGICVLLCIRCCCPKGFKTVGYNQPQLQQQQQQQQPAEAPVFHQEHQPANPPPYETSLAQKDLPYPVQQYNHQYQYQLQPLGGVQNFQPQPPPYVAAEQSDQKY